jgi:DNA-binding IclR family transcriptional regulator
VTGVPSLNKGLKVLALLSRHGKPMTASAIAFELGLSRSSTYRLLAELCAARVVRHHVEDQRYGLGPALLPLAASYRKQHARNTARPTKRTR